MVTIYDSFVLFPVAAYYISTSTSSNRSS